MISNINKCAKKHFWIKGEKCPFCGGVCVEKVEYRSGDCISCGQLCPESGYCCTDPAPLSKEELQFSE